MEQPPNSLYMYTHLTILLDRCIFLNFEVHRRKVNFDSTAEIEECVDQFLAEITVAQRKGV